MYDVPTHQAIYRSCQLRDTGVICSCRFEIFFEGFLPTKTNNTQNFSVGQNRSEKTLNSVIRHHSYQVIYYDSMDMGKNESGNRFRVVEIRFGYNCILWDPYSLLFREITRN